MSQENFNAIYSNLQNINNCKTHIKDVLVNKNQNLSGIPFTEYDQVVTNLVNNVSDVSPNLIYGKMSYITNTSVNGGFVILANNDNSFRGFANYQKAENRFNLTENYGLTANVQEVFSGTFVGDTRVVVEGKLGSQYITNINVTPELNKRLNAMKCCNFISCNTTITNFSGFFRDRQNLSVIPNFTITNVTDMSYMFCNTNVVSVPIYRVYNVVNMAGMFEDCKNLIVAPIFNTNNVVDMSNLYNGCVELFTTYVMNMDSVTNASNMFTNCINLSNYAYANIANMLPQATNLTNAYLADLGLNQSGFTGAQLDILNAKGYILN